MCGITLNHVTIFGPRQCAYITHKNIQTLNENRGSEREREQSIEKWKEDECAERKILF
jgi:hypothetical protein